MISKFEVTAGGLISPINTFMYLSCIYHVFIFISKLHTFIRILNTQKACFEFTITYTDQLHLIVHILHIYMCNYIMLQIQA